MSGPTRPVNHDQSAAYCNANTETNKRCEDEIGRIDECNYSEDIQRWGEGRHEG